VLAFEGEGVTRVGCTDRIQQQTKQASEDLRMKLYYDQSGIQIIHGDCWEILPELGMVDHVITDPPYSQEHTHQKHSSSVISRQALGFSGLSEEQCVSLAVSWVKKASRWCVFTCEWHYMEALHRSGVLIRFGIWRKPGGAPQFTGDRPGTGWEGVAICHREGKKRWNGGGRHAFWQVPVARGTGHPTEKPLKLYTSFITDFTDPDDVILDPFMGSGTTLRAAKDLGRQAIGIEIEERYCEIAARRCSQEVLAF